jgi:replicative DNA helicase
MNNNLTQEELNKLSKLENVDSVSDHGKYDFGSEMEQSVLAAMIVDRTFMVQITELIKPHYFSHHARQVVCETAQSYFKEYKDVPTKGVLLNEIKEKTKNSNKPFVFYEAEVNAILDGFEIPDSLKNYLLDKIEEFAKVEAFKYAWKKSSAIFLSKDDGKWNKMADIVRESFNVSRQKELGLDYFVMLEERYARMKSMKENSEVFITGFRPLDEALSAGGLGRGEVGAYLGNSGSGKSMLLVQTAIENLNRGKKVLFLSLEMDQDKVAKRFDAMLSNTGMKDLLIEHRYVIKTLREGVLSDILSVSGDNSPSRLILKQFPAGTADVGTFRAYTSQLYQSMGFKPDLVIVDYVGEMKDYPGIATWESRQRLCRDLRAWGVEGSHCTFTALQPNRLGKEITEKGGVMDESVLGDSYGQTRVLDAFWSIMQTRAEKSMFVAKICNIKTRDGEAGVQIYVKQSSDTLRFNYITSEDYKNIMSRYKEQKASSTTIDGRPSKF